MRIKHFFGLAVLAAMTASCSSNNDLVVGGGNGSGENESGVSYASFSINLPTTSGTRADDTPSGSPSFNNGDKNEYAVNDATLVLFQKDASGNFNFKETVDLGNMEPWTSSSTSGITTTAKLTAKITTAEVGSNKGYYALIVLNNNKGTAQKITYPEEGQTYADWSKDAGKATAANYLKHDNGFFMANAPKYVADGTPETLVEIKNIYASKQEAENSTATTVYVERDRKSVV